MTELYKNQQQNIPRISPPLFFPPPFFFNTEQPYQPYLAQGHHFFHARWPRLMLTHTLDTPSIPDRAHAGKAPLHPTIKPLNLEQKKELHRS